MDKIQIRNLNKIYKIHNNESFFALKNVNLNFSTNGLVSIYGKSGSGKSTLLNMIAKLDKPSEGEIYIDGKNINKIKQEKYYKQKVSILFQQYNLIEEYSAIYNVSLPLLIKGYKSKKAYKRAKEILEKIGINETIQNKKVSLLSGGEKQRIALARCLINDTDIVLCDEPTGALDSNNSLTIMNILKEISKTKLVICVSHNLQLIKNYSDRIIKIKDGIIDSDHLINNINSFNSSKKVKRYTKKLWNIFITIKNFRKHLSRNIFSLLGIGVAITTLLINIGFINGRDNAIEKIKTYQANYGIGTIAQEEKLSGGSFLSLTRMNRPDINVLKNNENITQNYYIFENYDAIIPPNLNCDYDGIILENIFYEPIYTFNSSKLKKQLINGYVPNEDTLNEAIINQNTYQYFKEQINKDPLNETLNIFYSIKTAYEDYDGTIIEDEFIYKQKLKIVGVIYEFPYLLTNKVYYSFLAIREYLQNNLLLNLSTYFNYDISWDLRIKEVSNSSPLSSYSYRLFPKENISIDIKNYLKEGLTFTSNSELIIDSLNGFLDVTNYGMVIFLIISILGAALIIGLTSLSSYNEDHKKSAILTCVGASNKEIKDIYIGESILVTLISSISSFPVALIFQNLGNIFINKLLYIKDYIDIPILRFQNLPYLLPVIVIALSILIGVFSTIIPINFSKKVDLKKELQTL